MMDFIMMTVSIIVAILVSSALGFLLMTNEKALKWFMNYFVKSMENFDNSLDDLELKDL